MQRVSWTSILERWNGQSYLEVKDEVSGVTRRHTMADGLAYVYKYTGEKRFLDAAGKFYATGTIDPVWKDDPPVYMGTKDLANACNWGMVYMSQKMKAGK